ncbi:MULTISPECIES: hypothetical protein [unclassified Moraxella]|uniref:hypothetical protein n=1 Tax=unclassified Moraxella TaxID=2685852 RepID=UPI00359D8A46
MAFAPMNAPINADTIPIGTIFQIIDFALIKFLMDATVQYSLPQKRQRPTNPSQYKNIVQ